MSATTAVVAQPSVGSLTLEPHREAGVPPLALHGLVIRSGGIRPPGVPGFRKIYQAAPKGVLGPQTHGQLHEGTGFSLFD